MPAAALGDMDRVRRYGADNGFPLLEPSSFAAEQKPVAMAGVMAGDVLNAEGLFRDQTSLELHFTLHELELVSH